MEQRCLLGVAGAPDEAEDVASSCAAPADSAVVEAQPVTDAVSSISPTVSAFMRCGAARSLVMGMRLTLMPRLSILTRNGLHNREGSSVSRIAMGRSMDRAWRNPRRPSSDA